ncbi:TPA: RidA family protein [Stenotrophomonas maltophilia]
MSAAIRKTASFGVPWESAYGYVQAVRVNNTIFVSGQLSHTAEGQLVAPAELGASGKPANFDTMEAQMRRTYENAQALLAELGGPPTQFA